uniref:HDC00810 n=1 Tax=Drosophila melanogaster TaxID=7227 RepID=Q6IHV1_DROME|nr:TPA_inf: HDC00810 [Drosophila melanogaster]
MSNTEKGGLQRVRTEPLFFLDKAARNRMTPLENEGAPGHSSNPRDVIDTDKDTPTPWDSWSAQLGDLMTPWL